MHCTPSAKSQLLSVPPGLVRTNNNPIVNFMGFNNPIPPYTVLCCAWCLLQETVVIVHNILRANWAGCMSMFAQLALHTTGD